MKKLLFLLICLSVTASAVPLFESLQTLPLEGRIEKGRLLSPTYDEEMLEWEIHQQLRYAIHPLRALLGSPALDFSLELVIESIEERTDGLFDVTYRAAMLIAWERTEEVPEDIMLILPERGDDQGLRAFFEKYAPGAHCGFQEKPDWSLFWYYYEPRPPGCPLGKNPDAPSSVRFPLSLHPGSEETSGKYPEYEKVWEDGQLVVTAVFGNLDSRRRDAADLHESLATTYGKAVSHDFENKGYFHVEHAVYDTPSGPLDVMTFDIKDGNVQEVGEDFIYLYDERTLVSDLVSYNGHSGLGANVRAFSRLGEFSPGQYQIYYFHGCVTFNYFDDTLFQSHYEANPDDDPSKYLDIITTTGIGAFGAMAPTNARLIESLVLAKEPYREILAKIGEGAPAVVGEEDNAWPAPF